MKINTVEISNPLLLSNAFLMKSLCILWMYQFTDMLFVPYLNYVQVNIKKNSWKMLNKIDYETFNRLKMVLKIATNLDLVKNIPQSSSFSFKINKLKHAIRVSFHPTNLGESISLRILKNNFFSSDLVLNYNNGINIIAGKTGSGKTSLLYSLIAKFSGHIVTLEDPIEYEFPNICQTDVSILGYDEGIKSALRQTPDLIVIGETRDSNSANALLRAAYTGHSVLTTLHAFDLKSVFSRLNDLHSSTKFPFDIINSITILENFNYTYFSYEKILSILGN